MKTNPPSDCDAHLLQDSRTSGEVADNLSALCLRIGPRFSGTPGYRRAADHMLAQFERYRLDRPHLEPFSIRAWRRGPDARLTVTAPVATECPCYELVYSAPTGPSGVQAEVIDMIGGEAERFESRREQIPGRFVLITSGGRHRMEIYDHCVAVGARGLIYSTRAEGNLLCSGSVGDGIMGAIPAVSIGKDTATGIQQLLQNGTVRLRLITDSHSEPDQTWNVVGELTGSEKPDEFIIVGGHLDSHEIGQGAYDNAAGAVMVMEMARLLAGQRGCLGRTVRFIGFAAEEVGLLGSQYHARAHAGELSRARLMFNCDTPAVSEPWIISAHRFSAFENYSAGLSNRLGVALTCRLVNQQHSDHYPFTRRGVPALALAGSRQGVKPGGPGHTAADTLEKLPIAGLQAAATLAARIVLQAANDEHWPAGDGAEG